MHGVTVLLFNVGQHTQRLLQAPDKPGTVCFQEDGVHHNYAVWSTTIIFKKQHSGGGENGVFFAKIDLLKYIQKNGKIPGLIHKTFGNGVFAPIALKIKKNNRLCH